MDGFSRRSVLAGLGVLGAAGVAGGGFAGGYAMAQPAPVPVDDQMVPFRGTHQGGITTEQQDRMLFAAFDVTTTDAAELREMLRDWTTAAEAMTRAQ